MKYIAPALIALALGGCAELGRLAPISPGPICAALIGPIKYNSDNNRHGRFAGKNLAPDLKQRNQVGQKLGCPAYRR
jgi:hypothetical protein